MRSSTCRAHSIIGAGPIENMQHNGASPTPQSIPAITTTKPNCLLFCAYTATLGSGPVHPDATTPHRSGKGSGAAYIAGPLERLPTQRPGPRHLRADVDRLDSVQRVTSIVVMQVSPRPAPPEPGPHAVDADPVVRGDRRRHHRHRHRHRRSPLGATSVKIGTTTIPAGSVTVLAGRSSPSSPRPAPAASSRCRP